MIEYLLNGGGRWMTRLHCTGHDYYLLWFTIVGATLMITTYFIYAYRTFTCARNKNQTSLYIKHSIWLTVVFVICGMLHLITNVLAWFYTPYYIIAIVYYINAYLTYRLNKSKYQLMLQIDSDFIEKVDNIDTKNCSDRELATLIRNIAAERVDRQSKFLIG